MFAGFSCETKYTRSGLEWNGLKIFAALDLCREDKALVWEHIKDMVPWFDPPLPEFYDGLLEQSAPALSPIEDHLSAILVEATRLHKEAMSQLGGPTADPLTQLREAKRLLAEEKILASDAASYVDATQMDTTLADLHRQQGQVDAMMFLVEARKRDANSSVWGWIVIGAMFVIVAVWAV